MRSAVKAKYSCLDREFEVKHIQPLYGPVHDFITKKKYASIIAVSCQFRQITIYKFNFISKKETRPSVT